MVPLSPLYSPAKLATDVANAPSPPRDVALLNGHAHGAIPVAHVDGKLNAGGKDLFEGDSSEYSPF